MATYYGVNATKNYTGGLSNQLGQGLTDGRVKVLRDYYTLLGSEASGSVIQFAGYSTTGTLPEGAVILAIELTVTTAQTSLTFSLGNTASATAYAAASNASLQTVGCYLFGGKQTVVGTTTGDNDLLITTGGATATAGILYVAIFYTID